MKLSLNIKDHSPESIDFSHANAVAPCHTCDDICPTCFVDWKYKDIKDAFKLNYTFNVETVDGKPQITITDPVLKGYVQLFYDNEHSDDVEDTLFTADSFTLHIVPSYSIVGGYPINYELDIDFQKMLIKILFL